MSRRVDPVQVKSAAGAQQPFPSANGSHIVRNINSAHGHRTFAHCAAAPQSKLINNADDAVKDALTGLSYVSPHISILDGFDKGINVAINTCAQQGHVAVVGGGGSGHEPATTGYVGQGMLAAAVCGSVFASPTAEAVSAAVRAADTSAGCLLVILNYTGDRLNFGLAEEMAKGEGRAVQSVLAEREQPQSPVRFHSYVTCTWQTLGSGMQDDCGVPEEGIAGRRGIAGYMLVCKGLPLADVKAAASKASEAIASMGAALSTCTLPGAPPATEARIQPGQMELGLGIHGEPGAERCDLRSASETVRALLQRILAAERGAKGRGFQEDDRVALLVNNLGSTTALELNIVAGCALEQLQDAGLQVERCVVGTFMSALDMAGASISLMHLDAQLLELLDAPLQAFAWPAHVWEPVARKRYVAMPEAPQVPGSADANSGTAQPTEGDPERVRRAVEAAARACIDAEPQLTQFDSQVGDSDCGETLKRGGEAVLAATPSIDFTQPGAAAAALASAVARGVGGTSGALYQIFLAAASASLLNAGVANVTPTEYAQALRAGVDAIKKHGKAQQGDCTMIDALQPAADSACSAAAGNKSAHVVLEAAAAAAKEGAEATRKLVARGGRSSYVSAEVQANVPDPGAWAVALWLQAAADSLVES